MIEGRYFKAIQDLVHELALGNYDGLVEADRVVSVTASEVREAVESYPDQIMDLPEEAAAMADVVEHDFVPDTTIVYIPIWTATEGRSDLTLQVWIEETDGKTSVRMYNLHVM